MRYGGSVSRRDGPLTLGIVYRSWPWLLGPWVETWIGHEYQINLVVVHRGGPRLAFFVKWGLWGLLFQLL